MAISDYEAKATVGILRTAQRHALVTAFLNEHVGLLASLSYAAMEERMGDEYDDTHVSFYTGDSGVYITVYRPDQRSLMRTLRRAIGGEWRKGSSSWSFNIKRDWGLPASDVTITINIEGDREAVCQKVVIGTHEKVIPAVEAQPERTEIVEEVEWVCGSLLTD